MSLIFRRKLVPVKPGVWRLTVHPAIVEMLGTRDVKIVVKEGYIEVHPDLDVEQSEKIC